MWCWRRVLKVKCMDRKTNEWVLQQAGEEQQLLKKIRKRRQKWIGYVLRRLVKMVIEWLEGKRGRGRRMIGMLDNFGVSFPDLKRWAEDWKEWRRRQFPCWTLDLPLLGRAYTHTHTHTHTHTNHWVHTYEVRFTKVVQTGQKFAQAIILKCFDRLPRVT